jgi:hypothetical protein
MRKAMFACVMIALVAIPLSAWQMNPSGSSASGSNASGSSASGSNASGSSASGSNASGSNASGTWVLNPAKSNFNGMPAPKDVKLTIDEKGDSLKYDVSGTGPDGKPFHESYDGTMNGKPVNVVGAPTSSTASFTKTADGVTGEYKSDHGPMKLHSSVAPDGKTLNVEWTATDKDGKPVSWTEVYDKQ